MHRCAESLGLACALAQVVASAVMRLGWQGMRVPRRPVAVSMMKMLVRPDTTCVRYRLKRLFVPRWTRQTFRQGVSAQHDSWLKWRQSPLKRSIALF